nr:hypothetical protein BaRGS_001225 [Batillaria attramentaria]
MESAFPSVPKQVVLNLVEVVQSSTRSKTQRGRESDTAWDPPVDLEATPLSEGEKRQVRQLLREECEAFSRDDDDIGCIEELEMDIKLTDNTPVQRPYVSIPPPMY